MEIGDACGQSFSFRQFSGVGNSRHYYWTRSESLFGFVLKQLGQIERILHEALKAVLIVKFDCRNGPHHYLVGHVHNIHLRLLFLGQLHWRWRGLAVHRRPPLGALPRWLGLGKG